MFWGRKPKEKPPETDPLRATLHEIAPILEKFAATPDRGPFATANGSPLIYSDGLPCYFLVMQGADKIVRRIQISSFYAEDTVVLLEVRALALLTTRDGEPVARADATEFHQRNEIVINVPADAAETALPIALEEAYDLVRSWGRDDLNEGIAVA